MSIEELRNAYNEATKSLFRVSASIKNGKYIITLESGVHEGEGGELDKIFASSAIDGVVTCPDEDMAAVLRMYAGQMLEDANRWELFAGLQAVAERVETERVAKNN